MRMGPMECQTPTEVYDVPAREQLKYVVWVDPEAGEVGTVPQPPQKNEAGDGIKEDVLRYDRIYPIYGPHSKPVAFHCYGRQP